MEYLYYIIILKFIILININFNNIKVKLAKIALKPAKLKHRHKKANLLQYQTN